MTGIRANLLLVFAALLMSHALPAQQYDVVIEGGRVMDPETGLDAIRQIGLRDGRIARISSETLRGAKTIDARGLVVAPGFIDLHQHAQDPENYQLKALDGVTTALELEIGAPDVTTFLQERQAHALVNFGTSASHAAARAAAFGTPIPRGGFIVPNSGPATNNVASPDQIQSIKDRLNSEIRAGALSIGIGIQYTPGASRAEIIQMFRLAAQNRLPVFTHVRSVGPVDPGSVGAVEEVLGAAVATGASLHIVHVNSTSLKDSPECLAMIAGARARGLDVTTEAYPYVAGMTSITSALFNPGWREKFAVDYSDLMLPESGERLTKERFEMLHNSSTPRTVVIFMNTDAMVDYVIENPLVMIASDGARGHPRNSGTYSRILAHYVREEQKLTLMDAIRKMSLMPARRLEMASAAARNKGRLQEGADADIVAFDPRIVIDRSTYAHPQEHSIGFQYVLVNGTEVVDHGNIVANVFPGRALVNDHAR